MGCCSGPWGRASSDAAEEWSCALGQSACQDEWCTSKLVGETVFDSSGDNAGTIDDLLTDDSGKISQAVISTGGVLGMGKLVEVPFDQLKFEPSAGNNGTARAAGTQNTPAGSNLPAAGNASTTIAANQAPGRPTYYSLVLLSATKDSLPKQQTFKYASTG